MYGEGTSTTPAENMMRTEDLKLARRCNEIGEYFCLPLLRNLQNLIWNFKQFTLKVHSSISVFEMQHLETYLTTQFFPQTTEELKMYCENSGYDCEWSNHNHGKMMQTSQTCSHWTE